MDMWMNLIKLAKILCLEGEDSNDILMALTLFLRSHKYFVISNFDQNRVSTCYPFKKSIILLTLHLCDTKLADCKLGKHTCRLN